jgi:aryl-alcohol dehydrogenase-like predicted oxidoreductase
VRSRRLGKTGITCSELGLGTWGLSGDGYGPVNSDEQDRVISRARALGITLYETADVYGGGAMEERLARALGNDERCIVVTKIGTDLESSPPRKCFDTHFLYARLDGSRARLLPRQPDIVLLHNPSVEVLERGDAANWLQYYADCGNIRAWGVSAGSAAVAKAAIGVGAQVVELAFNLFWADDLRAVEQAAREKETAILVRSVLAHGLLSGFWSPERTFPAGDHRAERWTNDDLRRRIHQLDAIRPLVKAEVPTLRAAALRWVLGHEIVNSAVIGPRSCIQLDQLVREAGKAPPYLDPLELEPLELRLQNVGARR